MPVDVTNILATVGLSGIVSVAVAQWLAGRLVDHRLGKDMADYRAAIDRELTTLNAQLDARLATSKSEIDARLHREVEEYLGERSAERQYASEARKRLYAAIGPLRFQLITACVDYVARVAPMARKQQVFKITLDAYFGRSIVFRLLRLFAITELIERQMAHADFSVEPSTVVLLRFKYAAYRCLSSGKILLNHPGATWDEQVEHVFFDTLSMIAASLIVSENTRERVMRFDEFVAFLRDPAAIAALHPIPRLFEGFTTYSRPILWLRLIALAHLCETYVALEGPSLGIKARDLDISNMIAASEDEFIIKHLSRYRSILAGLASELTSVGSRDG